MSESEILLPQKEITKPPIVARREIIGLNQMLSQESVGGNAGPGRAAVNAIYNGGLGAGEFTFITGSVKEGEITNVLFYIWVGDLGEKVEQGMAGIPVVPSLIQLVEVSKSLSEIQKETLRRRTLEHNAYQIVNFLRTGGKISDLPKDVLLPDLETLEKIAKARGKGN